MPVVTDIGAGGEDKSIDEKLDVKKVSDGDTIDDDDDDFEDETLVERVLALREMFPERVRDVTAKVADKTWGATKRFYSFGREATWVLFTSALILFVPPMFEREMQEISNMEQQEQRKMLLGDDAAASTRAMGASPFGGMPQPTLSPVSS